MTPPQIAALILLIAGVATPVMCIIKMRMIQRFRQKAIATTAAITHIEKRSGPKSTYYLLQLQYKVIDTGAIHSGHAVSVSKKHKPGDTVPLMYLPGKPEIYSTDFGKWLRWMLGASMVVFAAIIWFCYWLLSLKYTYQPH